MITSVHFEGIIYTVRFYSEGKSFENKDEYDGVMTITVIGDTAFASGLHGTIGRNGYRLLLEHLDQLGIKTLVADRNENRVEYRIRDWLDRMR